MVDLKGKVCDRKRCQIAAANRSEDEISNRHFQRESFQDSLTEFFTKGLIP